MSDALQDFEEELLEILGNLKSLLEVEIPKLKGKARVEKCEFAKNRLSRAKQLLKSYNIELRDLSRADAKPFEEKAREMEQEITKLSDELNWALSSAERDELMNNKGRNADEMTAKQLVETAKQVQDESKASTARTKQVLQTTVQIGSETSETLKHQTEQLGNVDQTMDVIENNLKRADKQIRIFLRRMATDKVIMSLILLVVLGIAGAITTYFVKKQTNPDDAGAGPFGTGKSSIFDQQLPEA